MWKTTSQPEKYVHLGLYLETGGSIFSEVISMIFLPLVTFIYEYRHKCIIRLWTCFLTICCDIIAHVQGKCYSHPIWNWQLLSRQKLLNQVRCTTCEECTIVKLWIGNCQRDKVAWFSQSYVFCRNTFASMCTWF